MGRRHVTPALEQHAQRSLKRARRRRGERGAAAVEFALVLPLLAALLLGTVTVGLAYSNRIALNNAVREGARFGAAAPNTSSWPAAVVADVVSTYADADNPLQTTDVCALLIKKSGGGTPSYAVQQTSAPGCASGSTAAGSVPANPTSIPDGCFIKVWAQRPASLDWVFNATTVNLRGDSVALYDRTQLC